MRDDVLEGLGAILCGLPLVSLAAQIPLWPLRVYFGWRVERQFSAGKSSPPQPLAIRDLLAGMAVTSLSLAALRLMPANFQSSSEFWIGWAGAFVVIALISALSLVPATSILLRTKESGAALFGWFAYVLFMWITTLVVASAIAGSGPPEPFVGGTFVAFGSFAAAVALPLGIARSRGYRLTFPRDRRTPPGA